MNSYVINEHLSTDVLRHIFEMYSTVDISLSIHSAFQGGVCVEDSLEVVPGVPEINIRHPLIDTILPTKKTYNGVCNNEYPEPIDLETHNCWGKKGLFYVAQIYSMVKKIPVFMCSYDGMDNRIYIRATPDGKLEGTYYSSYDCSSSVVPDWLVDFTIIYIDNGKIVKLKGYDPTPNNNWVIKWASQNGHSEVVKYLTSLRDPTTNNNVDPTTNNNVDPTAYNDWAIKKANRYDHSELVKYLKSSRNSSTNDDWEL